MKKATIISLGCPKNRVDSDYLEGGLKELGFDITIDYLQSDLIIINTCGFIKPAKVESIDTIFNYLEFRKKDKPLFIVIGCLVERYKNELEKEIPEVDYFFGLNKWDEIKKEIVEYFGIDKRVSKKASLMRLNSKQPYAYIKVSEGCSNYCSYCTIPEIRGSFKSRAMEEIIQEAKDLIDSGVKEIILIGQDNSSYGIDIYHRRSLIELVEKISDLSKDFWLRIMYLHPENFDPNLINLMKNKKNICQYFELPVQHFSGKILKKMYRNYRSEDILKIFSRIRKNLPHSVIRSTVIVGFPGEEEEDFNYLVDLVKRAEIDYLGIFIYSREVGTPAYEFPGQIDSFLANERFHLLSELQNEIVNQHIMSKFLGRKEMIVEHFDYNEKKAIGRIKEQAPEIDGQSEILLSDNHDFNISTGDLIKVEIESFNCYDLKGRIL